MDRNTGVTIFRRKQNVQCNEITHVRSPEVSSALNLYDNSFSRYRYAQHKCVSLENIYSAHINTTARSTHIHIHNFLQRFFTEITFSHSDENKWHSLCAQHLGRCISIDRIRQVIKWIKFEMKCTHSTHTNPLSTLNFVFNGIWQ